MNNAIQNSETDPNNLETKTAVPLPPEVKEELVREVIEIISFTGPYPPPEILEKYEKVSPGAADRIMKIADEQSVHRRQIEIEIIKSDIHNSRLGLWFGLIVALAGLIVAGLSAYTGHEAAASIIGTGVLVSLVSTFIYGSATRQKEQEEKDTPKEN